MFVCVALQFESLPRPTRAVGLRARSLVRRRLLPASSRGSLRSPKFLEEPWCEHALLFPTPALCLTIGCSVSSLLPSTATEGVGFRATCRISGLNHTACSLAVYASPAESPLQTQHSLPAGHHPLLDRIRTCQVLIGRFPTTTCCVSLRHCLSPSRSFAWRTGYRRLQRPSWAAILRSRRFQNVQVPFPIGDARHTRDVQRCRTLCTPLVESGDCEIHHGAE